MPLMRYSAWAAVGSGGNVIGRIMNEDVQPAVGIGGGNLTAGVLDLPVRQQGGGLRLFIGGEGSVTGQLPQGFLVGVVAHAPKLLRAHTHGQAHHTARHQISRLHRLQAMGELPPQAIGLTGVNVGRGTVAPRKFSGVD